MKIPFSYKNRNSVKAVFFPNKLDQFELDNSNKLIKINTIDLQKKISSCLQDCGLQILEKFTKNDEDVYCNERYETYVDTLEIATEYANVVNYWRKTFNMSDKVSDEEVLNSVKEQYEMERNFEKSRSSNSGNLSKNEANKNLSIDKNLVDSDESSIKNSQKEV